MVVLTRGEGALASREEQRPKLYPRMARVNELLREILAEALERIDDERLLGVTVTAVQWWTPTCATPRSSCTSTSWTDPRPTTRCSRCSTRCAPTAAARSGQARLKGTPELTFPDPVVRSAIEDVRASPIEAPLGPSTERVLSPRR